MLWTTRVAIGLILAILLGTGCLWARQTYFDHLLRERLDWGHYSHPPEGWTRDALRMCRLGANPNLTSREGMSPLMVAATIGSREDIAWLLQHGANVNWSGQGVTVLMCAADTATANYLEQHGADPRAGNPAVGIYWYSDLNLIEWWLCRLPTANLQGTQGMTPLMYVARAGYPTRVELLLRYGADPNLRDRRGRSAADIVRKRLAEIENKPGLERRRRDWKAILKALSQKRQLRPSLAHSRNRTAPDASTPTRPVLPQ